VPGTGMRVSLLNFQFLVSNCEASSSGRSPGRGVGAYRCDIDKKLSIFLIFQNYYFIT